MNFLSVIIFSNVIKGSLGTSSISESDDFSDIVFKVFSGFILLLFSLLPSKKLSSKLDKP